MSRAAVIAAALAFAASARAQEVPAEPAIRPPAIPEELRETLPGGSRAGTARELPGATVDFLPKPTQVRIMLRRAAPEARTRR